MILAVIGKTNSGKDTVAKYMNDVYGIPSIVSYTTRTMRDYEEDGVQHWFIDEARMKEICDAGDLIAYTRNEQTGIEYCATARNLPAEDMVYIINPDGIRWFRENGAGIKMVEIYVDLSEEEIINRGVGRNDNLIILTTRLASEREEFDRYKESGGYNYLIDNSSDLKHLYSEVDRIMFREGFKKL